jgi:serine O-acetyltransferase
MSDLDRIINADLYRHDRLTGFKGFLKGWSQPGFRYTFLFRKTSQIKKSSLRGIFYRLLKRRYMYKYGFQISSDARIGEGFYLTDHFGTVIVGPVKIGKNCNINHSVTIGRAYKGGIAGRPTIDDYVWIGAGSVLVGDIKIGKNVLIAPNSFVNFDVPDNSLVIGNPGKIIPKENPTKYYINNVLNT